MFSNTSLYLPGTNYLKRLFFLLLILSAYYIDAVSFSLSLKQLNVKEN